MEQTYDEYYEYEKNYVDLPTDIDNRISCVMQTIDSISDSAGRELAIKIIMRLLNKRPLTCVCNNTTEWEKCREGKEVYFTNKRYNDLYMIMDKENRAHFFDTGYNKVYDHESDTLCKYLGGVKEVCLPYRVPKEPNVYEERRFSNGSVFYQRYEL